MKAWVPEDQRDTRYWIFNALFYCKVSNIQSQSLDYLQLHGMPCVGDATYDRQQANELIDRALCIVDMIELYNNGVTVRVSKYEDTKIIYERITDHLNAWKTRLESGFHMKDAPIEDLILMDKFAVSVYSHAKYQFTEVYVDSLIGKRLTSTMRIPLDQLITRKEITSINKIEDDNSEDKLPTRVSMQEIFASRRAAGVRKWS